VKCLNKTSANESLFNLISDYKIVLNAVHQGISKILEDVLLARLFIFLLRLVSFFDCFI